MRTALKLALGVALLAILLQFVFTKRFDPQVVKGKRVLVTGASMGIGEHIAYELSKLNAHVVIVARSVDKMQKISEKCKQLGAASINYISLDLGTKDEAALKQLIENSVRLLGGGLDMLILNHLSPGSQNVFNDWPKVFEERGISWLNDLYYLNVFSYLTLAHHALPHLERTGQGKLVVVSSMAGVIGMGITVGYSSQKHAVNGYFNGLRNNLIMNNRFNTSITTCILGAIGTEEMLNNAGNVKVSAAPVDDCARSIISSGFTDRRTLYYPYDQVMPAATLAPIFPELFDAITRWVVSN